MTECNWVVEEETDEDGAEKMTEWWALRAAAHGEQDLTLAWCVNVATVCEFAVSCF